MNSRVISLLNDYKNKDHIAKGVELLAEQFHIKNVFIRWLECDYYASTNTKKNRITICPRIRTKAFNLQTTSTHFKYDSKRVTHFTVIVLHEFGHVLINNNSTVLEQYYKQSITELSNEKIASKFAEEYIKGTII